MIRSCPCGRRRNTCAPWTDSRLIYYDCDRCGRSKKDTLMWRKKVAIIAVKFTFYIPSSNGVR